MWVERLQELKKKSGKSTKLIADSVGMSERSVSRILTGKAKRPPVDVLHKMADLFGVTLEEILAGTSAVIVSINEAVTPAEDENNILRDENSMLKDKVNILTAENDILNGKLSVLEAEIEVLRTKLEHKEELLALHDYYMKQRQAIT